MTIRPSVLLGIVLGLLISAVAARAAEPSGSVTGTIVDPAAGGQAVEFATITVQPAAGGQPVRASASDAQGRFAFEALPPGAYRLVFALVGGAREGRVDFSIDASHTAIDLGRLPLAAPEPPVKLERVEVTARRDALYNSIDRKTYLVGQDVQGVTGTASDVLQNIPSVQVDVEGNVSLRGDSSVLILVDGKTSAQITRDRAAALAALPADSIERIEVITNPSAKFKPDGTAGIINLVLKKNRGPIASGTLRVSVGDEGRFAIGLSFNHPTGRVTTHGMVRVAQLFNTRFATDERVRPDAAPGATAVTAQRTTETSRPFYRLGNLGFDYKPDADTKLALFARGSLGDFTRHAITTNTTRTTAGTVVTDYDRVRTDPERGQDFDVSAKLEHAFKEEGRELTAELRHSASREVEDNHFTNLYRAPVQAPAVEFVYLRKDETGTEATFDYSHPFGETAKLEVGYGGERATVDSDSRAGDFDAAGARRPDPARTNRFRYGATIHALYATFAKKSGRFGAKPGLRLEHAAIDTDQVTLRLTDAHTYTRLYPTLHLSWDLTEFQQLQLNYSHRVRRPDGDDLNPFPEYQDPLNLSAGNPRLRPEDTHSFEAGWQHRRDETTYTATVYLRERYHSFTSVTRFVDATTLLTTMENLGRSRSGGVELVANTRLRDRLSLNASANGYRNEIDAANLGFGARRATFAWEGKLAASFDATKATLVQFNANFSAKRLTPQGHRLPGAYANVGFRHNFADKKTSAYLTVVDVFASQRERTHLDTPALRRDTERRRAARIVYLGLVRHFGQPPKKPKKEDLPFDNAP